MPVPDLDDDLVEEYVEHGRLHGSSWAAMGEALGPARQAEEQLFLPPHEQCDPNEVAGELRQAMTVMKQVAAGHRNNYIGTEHLLWGITAEDNTATRLLASAGISAGDLRRSLGQRFTFGSSRAAERVAFTPYSRNAMAIARDLADRDGSPAISCAHLLAALAQFGRGVAAAVLHDTGADAAIAATLAAKRP